MSNRYRVILFSFLLISVFPFSIEAKTVKHTLSYREIPEDVQSLPDDECIRVLEDIYYSPEGDIGKLKWDHVFHEVKNEEQAEDLRKLEDAMEDDSLRCQDKVEHHLAYDKKWNWPEREKAKKEYEELAKKLTARVKDTGPEIWDGVVGDVYFHIPRAHIWSGSRTSDGYVHVGMNLIFHAPDMKPSDPGSPYGENSDIAGVLRIHPDGEEGNKPYTHRCIGLFPVRSYETI